MAVHMIQTLSRAPRALTLLAILAGSASCWMPFAIPTAEPSSTPAPTATPTPTEVPLVTPDPAVFPKRIVGYYTSWSTYARDYQAFDIPAHQLTHVNYAFANIDTKTGTCVLGDAKAEAVNLPRLAQLKQQHRHLRILISIGGWTWSGGFSDVALTEETRQRFVASCVDLFLVRHDDVFDGIDVDWEYPAGGGLPENVTRPEDTRNYTLLMAEFRRQIDDLSAQTGREYLLTIAGPAGPANYANVELQAISHHLDWINLMAYDFHGGWDNTTGFQSALYPAANDPTPALTADAAVQGYLEAGVPSEKIVLGVPFYGRGWAGAPATNDGLYQPAAGLPPGTWEQGVFDYKDLAANYVHKDGYARYWDDEAKVPWLYDPSAGVFITYEDPQSVGFKADYVNAQELGGVMLWELSADDGALLSTLHWRLRYGE
jgi:chitinase